MPQYSKTTWVDGTAPAISAANLNKLEQGVFDSIRQDGSTTMSAQLVTIAGSAATPAIAPTGDSNTGIFFPAADTIAFGEGGTEAMRINSSGQVGIGTSSPSAKLDVRSAGEIARFCGTNTSNTYITFSDGTTQFGDIGYDGRDTNALSIFNGQSGPLIFGAVSERVRITSAGNVGIGTTLPNTTFSWDRAVGISGTNSSAVELMTGATLNSVFATSATQTNIGTISNIPLVILTNNTEKMRITGAGNVGIGTTSPSAKLDAFNSGTTTTDLAVRNATVGTKLFVDSGAGYLQTTTAHDFLFGTNATERMRITSAGNVGIGTTTPDTLLHIKHSSQPTITFEDASANKGYVDFNSTRMQLHGGGGSIYFVAGSAERMRLTTAGYLLIGYTSSNGAYPLQVNGQIFATSSTIATSDGRYKKDVVALDGALDIVSKLNPVQFSWKEHPVHKFNTDVPTVGFIAQEVAEVLKDKAYLTSLIKKSECTWETETGETVEREVTRDVETQVDREITEEIDGEEVTRTVTETVIEQVTEIITEPVKETHTEEFFGIAESNMIAILTKAIQELKVEIDALKAQLAK